MLLLDQLGVNTPGVAASITLHEYVSDRSVAIMVKDGNDIGSGTCITIQDRCFIATVAHNVARHALSEIELILGGRKAAPKISILRGAFRRSPDPDLGWLEIDISVLQNAGVAPIPLRQLGSICDQDAEKLPVQIQGYPAARVKPGEEQSTRPGIHSLLFLRAQSQKQNDLRSPKE